MRVEALVKPTEDAEKVREALVRFFPDAAISEESGLLVATTKDLRPLRHRIWELRIIDTFRGQFLHGMAGTPYDHTTFRLSKQAALANHISFPPTPHVLGDLRVTVTAEPADARDIERLALWLCPETLDGEIVGPIEP